MTNFENRKNEIWKEIASLGHDFETSMDQLERKQTGFYLTSLALTDAMMNELVNKIVDDKKDISQLTFLEPCVGVGNFVFSYLKAISALHLPKEKTRAVIENIYVADINQAALDIYKRIFSEFINIYFGIVLDEKYFDAHIGKGLLLDVSKSPISYIEIKRVFPKSVLGKGFDIVVTNPPYKNLKAEKQQYLSDAVFAIDKQKYATISKIVDKQFCYSTDGVLNLYKLFVEEIVDSYTKDGGYTSLLLPSSILSDKSCSKLRSHLLLDNKIISIKAIKEGAGFIDAQQALCAVLLQKGGTTTNIQITADYANNPKQTNVINIHDIIDPNTENAIFSISANEYTWLSQLRKFPIVKDLSFIDNMRGELDLTANKNSIVSYKTKFPLLRGRNINYYNVDLTATEDEYILDSFVNGSKKNQYIYSDRIACQQVVNMGKSRRVTFAYIPANHVLGNSCNFISVKENEYGIDLYAILGLFNTSIINWFFKLTSSNNHVNNYEIDCFPVPVNSPFLKEIGLHTQQYLKTGDSGLFEIIEELAYKAYGIQPLQIQKSAIPKTILTQHYYEQIKHITPEIPFETATAIFNGELLPEIALMQVGAKLDEISHKAFLGVTEKFLLLKQDVIMNHTTFKLSDLDMEMIRPVPQGGSWKDIPEETVNKSKRLKRITQTGGRTTLYGRIDYTKPSYTITTYFNRPGNGTYIHPIHDRVLSVREAARFQGFKDDYYFYGNKTQHLKQIGNAVPTILAYQIAKQIVEKTGCCNSIDLFSGAGGMTAGFKMAGIQAIISNDIEKSACITLKINNPEIEVLCDDITKPETKQRIIQAAVDSKADIICGGPPCQGFSLAGFRSENDPRNQLFKEFVEIVNGVKPKVIVFENVEGLLSFQNGKVYKDILTLFSELGYKAEGRTLMANHYGVPQRRKRVIIICTRNDLSIEPRTLFPIPITEQPEMQITAFDTISDLENIPCDEKAKSSNAVFSPILKFFKGFISCEDYIQLIHSQPGTNRKRLKKAVQLSLDI